MTKLTHSTLVSAGLFLSLATGNASADTFTLDLPELTGTFVHGQMPISTIADFGEVSGWLSAVWIEFTATGSPGFSDIHGELPAEIVVSLSRPSEQLIDPTVLGPFEAAPTTLGAGNAWGTLDGDLAGSVGGGYEIEVLIETNDIYSGILSAPVVEISSVTINVSFEPNGCGLFGCDGFVGIAELNVVLSNWNLNVTPGDAFAGDFSGDGFIGIEDLNLVLSNWNAGTPPVSNAVPEPGTLALLGVLGLLPLRRRCR